MSLLFSYCFLPYKRHFSFLIAVFLNILTILWILRQISIQILIIWLPVGFCDSGCPVAVQALHLPFYTSVDRSVTNNALQTSQKDLTTSPRNSSALTGGKLAVETQQGAQNHNNLLEAKL